MIFYQKCFVLWCLVQNVFYQNGRLEEDAYRNLVLTCKSMRTALAGIPIAMYLEEPNLRADAALPTAELAPNVVHMNLDEVCFDGAGSWSNRDGDGSALLRSVAKSLQHLDIDTMHFEVTEEAPLQFHKLSTLTIDRCPVPGVCCFQSKMFATAHHESLFVDACVC